METDSNKDGALQAVQDEPEAAHDRDARPDGRDETEDERADRRWGELLQELRVAQTGMQILFGFLLAVVFQPRFTELNDVDHAIFVVTVGFGAATVGALIGPVALHRLVSGKGLKPQTVTIASHMTFTGLLLLFCTMVMVLLLILRVALHDTLAFWLVAGMAVWIAAWWFAIPLWARHRAHRMSRR
ncbi:DUF6328 family protein [Streptomyces sp. NPDC088915]|uniref:DUF6328 family protein n=1 Tax=Streptomyces sp. NPDC088915 TaxID=3365912 RepID=UPI00382656EE